MLRPCGDFTTTNFNNLFRFQMFLPQRQSHGKFRALPLLAAHRNFSMMQFHQFPGERQADAGAAVFPHHGIINLEEAVEDTGKVLGGNADAGVGDANF